MNVKFMLHLIRLSNLYTYLDTSGYRVAPNNRMTATVADIRINKPDYGSYQDLSGEVRSLNWYFLSTSN
jgi:hypothetical protein